MRSSPLCANMDHPRKSSLHRRLLFLVLPLLFVSLACQAALRLVQAPGTPQSPVQAQATACTGESCLDACLEKINERLGTNPIKPIENEYYRSEADINIVFYPVTEGQLGEAENLWVPDEYLRYQDDLPAHQRIWEFFTSVIPLELRSMLDRMMIFTDGPLNYSAWVEPTYGSDDTWTVGFDIIDSSDPFALTYDVIHEVGHLVTLNSMQIPPYDFSLNATATPGVCNQYMNYRGCSKEDSYINSFYQQFWTSIMDEWKELEKLDNADEFEEQRRQFYDRHGSEFVSEYAVTNIDEDLAETWTAFILEPKPAGDDIASRKVLFFYGFPELVGARDQIIDGLCLYAR